jgi:signal transduction histidine kinase
MSSTGKQRRGAEFVRTPVLALVTFFIVAPQWAGAAEQQRRIYFLESLSPAQPAAVRTIGAFTQRLREKSTERFEIFVDYMDLSRFPGQAHLDRTVKYLSEKYAEAPPDVLITLGRAANSVVANYRDVLAPNVPTVIANVPSREIAQTRHLNNVYWVATEYSFSKTLDLARELQPKARNLVVVGGASDYDRLWLDDARRELQPYSELYKIRYITDVPQVDLLKEASQLPKDTIVMMSFFFADGSGRPHVPLEVARSIAESASAPVYSPISSYLGTGIVGGYTDSWEAQGTAAADLALKILLGKDAGAIPRVTIPVQAYRIDERQLKRWNLRKASLPPEADVQFREFNLWEQYRGQIIAAAMIVFIQAVVIIWLYAERRRRRRAEQNLRQRLSEVIHLNRTALTGALSASVAHELNQPLGAIQSYAEAASLYLKSDPPNINRIEEILGNIRRDDKRAADIISHLRGLLKKRDEGAWQEFDVNDAVRESLRVVGPEASKRGFELKTIAADASLPVRGDPVHMQQVIMNLAMNGMDAMQICTPGEGRMSIETALAEGDEIEVSIADSGPGIPNDKIDEVFEPFYTTKGNGTGLGLSIARTIVETYGGKIWAENRPGGGAAFRFTLPLAKVPVS